MKEYKLERAYKVATMARNRLRKLFNLFECAYRANGSVEDGYYRELAIRCYHGMKAAERIATQIDKLHTWEIVREQSDEELIVCMEEAMLAVQYGKPGCTCLPNNWLFVAWRTPEGVKACLCEWLPQGDASSPRMLTKRAQMPLGIVRQRGTHSPRSLARKALAYAKVHSEDGATSENKEVRQWT